MGIDKANVGLVVHLDLPSSIENYVQETGRAGRNNKKSFAVLLYNNSDVLLFKDRLEKTLLSIKKSCLYSQSLVENYKDRILEAWKDQDLKYLSNLDYISLIDWKHYTEIKERRVA